jgi:hypothetical protein
MIWLLFIQSLLYKHHQWNCSKFQSILTFDLCQGKLFQIHVIAPFLVLFSILFGIPIIVCISTHSVSFIACGIQRELDVRWWPGFSSFFCVIAVCAKSVCWMDSVFWSIPWKKITNYTPHGYWWWCHPFTFGAKYSCFIPRGQLLHGL